MPWRKLWIKQGCSISHCIKHNITWEDKEDATKTREFDLIHSGDNCPVCKAEGLKGVEWIPE